ncbi:MAG: type II/IV secretion system protein [Puniceicoccaceae bacterium]|nr:MAG: type II/IV secretion system protein [Puniceicoccaceae bacterium]
MATTEEVPPAAAALRPVQPDYCARTRAWLSKPSEEGDPDGLPSAAELADALLVDARRERATDVHLDSLGGPARLRFRIDGDLIDVAELPEAAATRLLGHLKTQAGLEPGPAIAPLDGRIRHRFEDAEDLQVRLAAIPATRGEKLVLRLIDPGNLLLSLEDLGLSHQHYSIIRQWLDQVRGMFLVTGPTGSGKTTTLYAILQELRLLPRNLLTIEDPVELDLEGITQVQAGGRGGISFDDGIRSMLRLDPDFLLVGEIRDPASARAAIGASATGRILLSSLHSRDASGTVTALRNHGLSNPDIATALEVVIHQRLARRLCPECAEEADLSKSDRAWLKAHELEEPSSTRTAPGCRSCRGTGFKGRIGLFEVWHLQDEDKEGILNSEDERRLRARIRGRGIRDLAADGYNKVADGTISMDEFRRAAGTGPV